MAKEIESSDSNLITVVPLEIPSDEMRYYSSQMVIYSDSECEHPFEVIRYITNIEEGDAFHNANSEFNGAIVVHNLCNLTERVFYINEGSLFAPIHEMTLERTEGSRNEWWEDDPCTFEFPPIECWEFGNDGPSLWDKLRKWVRKNIKLTESTGENPPDIWDWWNNQGGDNGFPAYNTNWTGGGGSLDGFFNQPFFNGEGSQVEQTLENLINEHDLLICTEMLYTALFQCINLNLGNYNIGPPPPPDQDLNMNTFLDIISTLPPNDGCLSEVENTNSSEYDMTDDDGTFLCYLRDNFAPLNDTQKEKIVCIKNAFDLTVFGDFEFLIENLEFTIHFAESIGCPNVDPNLNDDLFDFAIDVNNFISEHDLDIDLLDLWNIVGAECVDASDRDYCILEKYIDFITENSLSSEDEILLTDFSENAISKTNALKYISTIHLIKQENIEIKWIRSLELYNLVESDPDALTKCGSPSADISFWSDLASFIPPQEVLNRLDELGEGWRLQHLLTPTATPSINLDYFSVKISEMPFNSETGELWIPEELFENIRMNINDFVDTDKSEFVPIEGDESIWLSNDPISSVISIDIGPLDYVGDDGSVICAQKEPCCWIFSTVKAPHFPLTSDGHHPVSGNRQFGFNILPNGDMEIYTKGVDRFLSPTSGSGPLVPITGYEQLIGYILGGIGFSEADKLWESFQQGIIDFVSDQDQNGEAEVYSTIKNRPKVSSALIQLLSEDYPINHVPCGN